MADVVEEEEVDGDGWAKLVLSSMVEVEIPGNFRARDGRVPTVCG